mmetsp:Transcript_22383/g.42205  ORF Transcript_22383/g.42205 Transcript_22383/m.42205 type:complete len:376 (+) Transcript_22383:27-1154(+)
MARGCFERSLQPLHGIYALLLCSMMFTCFQFLDRGNATTRSDAQQLGVGTSRDSGCLQFGRWVPHPTASNVYKSNKCNLFFAHFCTGQDEKRTLAWKWEAASASCPELNPRMLATWLANKTVLLVGDSATQQQAVSLHCLLAQYLSENPARAYGRGFPSRLINGASITFARLDSFLHTGGNGTLELHPDWPHELLERADVVVLNTGFHKGGYDTEEKREALIRIVTNYLAEMSGHGMFIYRSLYMPADNCRHAAAPFQQYSDVPRRSDHYTFEYISSMDSAWRNAFAKLGPRFMFHNVSVASSLRVDGHTNIVPGTTNRTDCLHFCLPGVVDLWSWYMFADSFGKGMYELSRAWIGERSIMSVWLAWHVLTSSCY